MSEALVKNIVEDGLSGVRFEGAAEIVFLQAGQAGKLIEPKWLREVCFDVLAEPFDPDGGASSRRSRHRLRREKFLLGSVAPARLD